MTRQKGKRRGFRVKKMTRETTKDPARAKQDQKELLLNLDWEIQKINPIDPEVDEVAEIMEWMAWGIRSPKMREIRKEVLETLGKFRKEREV